MTLETFQSKESIHNILRSKRIDPQGLRQACYRARKKGIGEKPFQNLPVWWLTNSERLASSTTAKYFQINRYCFGSSNKYNKPYEWPVKVAAKALSINLAPDDL